MLLDICVVHHAPLPGMQVFRQRQNLTLFLGLSLSKLSFLPGSVLRYQLGTSGFSALSAREAARLPQSKKNCSEKCPVCLDHEGLVGQKLTGQEPLTPCQEHWGGGR